MMKEVEKQKQQIYILLPCNIFSVDHCLLAIYFYWMDRQMRMNIAAKASFESQWFFQVPVVRKTGGLAGTVLDMDDLSSHEIANG
jgi:hypothetical protein